MTKQRLTCGSITYWAGGHDHRPGAEEHVGAVGGSWDRLDQLGEVIGQGLTPGAAGPRVLFWQHGNWFDVNGSELMHRVERLLAPFGRYRGHLTRSDWNITHDVVFLREADEGEPELWVRHHWTEHEPDHCRPRTGLVEVQVGDDGPVLLLRSVLLYPWSGEQRVEQIKGITAAVRERGKHVRGGVTAILGGSLNCTDTHPNNPQRNWAVAAAQDPEGVSHKGKCNPGTGEWEPDTGVWDHLLGRWSAAAGRRFGGAGWVSLSQLDGNWEATVEHDVDKGGPLKINDFLSNRNIVVPGSSRTHAALTAGKHRYITITVEV